MHSPSTRQSEILQSFVRPQVKPYVPEFHVECDVTRWRIFDRDTAIGLVGDTHYPFFDLWSFSPFESPIMANTRPPGKVVDLHTLHNTVINLPFTFLTDLVEGVADPYGRLRMQWLKNRGNELELEISGQFEKGQRIVYHFRVKYEPQWARYRYFFDADAWKLTIAGMEPINMMMAGALASRPEKRRWTHSIWEDANGQLRRLVHSNALFSCTDYAHPTGEWRSRNAPFHGAWVAYAAHPIFNPAMLIHQTSAPIYLGTCSQLFDEHIVWHRAGLDDLDEGYFHFAIRTELVNLPPGLARDFLERAVDPPRPKQWRLNKVALAFRLDEINSFETPVDPWLPEDCPILVMDAAESEPIRWVNDQAHSGRHSIRFEGRRHNKWTTLFPGGAVCDVEPHARYRFSAWVKTRNVARFARLELNGCEYYYHNLIDVAQSSKLSGDCEWTLLQVELDTQDEAYVLPCFKLYGTGTAWFDDAKLERV